MEETLTYPKPWIQPIEWKYGILKKPILRKFNDTDKIHRKIFKNGTPLETESDHCISSMMNGYYKGGACKVAEECELMLLRNDNPQGYPLTHRLLLVCIAKVVSPYQNSFFFFFVLGIISFHCIWIVTQNIVFLIDQQIFRICTSYQIRQKLNFESFLKFYEIELLKIKIKIVGSIQK